MPSDLPLTSDDLTKLLCWLWQLQHPAEVVALLRNVFPGGLTPQAQEFLALAVQGALSTSSTAVLPSEYQRSTPYNVLAQLPRAEHGLGCDLSIIPYLGRLHS